MVRQWVIPKDPEIDSRRSCSSIDREWYQLRKHLGRKELKSFFVTEYNSHQPGDPFQACCLHNSGDAYPAVPPMRLNGSCSHEKFLASPKSINTKEELDRLSSIKFWGLMSRWAMLRWWSASKEVKSWWNNTDIWDKEVTSDDDQGWWRGNAMKLRDW